MSSWDRSMYELLEISARAKSSAEFRAATTAWIRKRIAVDGIMVVGRDLGKESPPGCFGFDDALVGALKIPKYATEVLAIARLASSYGGFFSGQDTNLQ